MSTIAYAGSAAAAVCDPVTLEVIAGATRAAQREMEVLIERTAMSPFIREKKDFHAGIFSGDGELIATISSGGSTNSVAAVLETFPRQSMRDGDLYWFNDCYASQGAVSHSPDQVFIMPVFAEGRIVAFVEGWAHFNDIGGIRPGSVSPVCTDVFQEGIIIPPVRLMRDGALNEDLLRVFYRNSRFPDLLRGDVRALLAAVQLGKRRMEEYAARFGAERLADAFRQLVNRTGREVRARARALLKPGEYRFTETVDSDGQGHGPFKIRCKLNVSDDRFTLDVTETDDQAPGPINLILTPTNLAMDLGTFLLRGDPHFMVNSGACRVLDDTRIRPGSLLQPNFPAPLGLRGATRMRARVAMQGLVAVATQGESNAGSPAFVIYYLRGQTDQNVPFLLSDGTGVGYGARPYADGNDAVYFTANENYPCEFVELNFPVRVRRYAIHEDTGGPGRWRGGCGVIRELEVLAEEAVLSLRIDSTSTPPWGLKGGLSGKPGYCVINPGTPDERRIEPVSDGTILRKGDVFSVRTPGGGGWGHPFDREAERVLEDVLDGFVSRASAEADYGVVLTADGLEVDVPATQGRRSSRPDVRLFHQSGYRDRLGD